MRRALAYTINYPLIAQTAMSDYSVPANASLVVPGGGEDSYYDAEAVAQDGWSFDPNRAVEILENELGAKKGGDGIYVLPDGTRLGPWDSFGTLRLERLESSVRNCRLECSSRRDSTSVRIFPKQSVWQTDQQNGNFDLTMNTPTGASAAGPWPRFRDVLDIRGVPEAGQTAFWNYGRLQ